MALPILAHWAGRSIFDIEPAALARRGIRLPASRSGQYPGTLWGTGAHTGGEGLGGGPGRAGDHPLCALQQPAPGAAPPVFPGAGRALPGPRGQAEAGGLPAGHGADGLHAGADCHRGGSALYRHSGRAERRGVHSAGGAYPPGGQSGALPALRSGVALPHVEQKGGQNRYERNLRTGGQRRVLSI